MLVGGRVYKQPGLVQKKLLQGVGDAEEEDDFGLGRDVQGGDDGSDGGVVELEGVCEGDELVVIADILGDPGIVAA